jgi:hypothetical protein
MRHSEIASRKEAKNMATSRDKIIHAALFTPTSYGWGLPLLFWASPGCGKSAILEAIARKVGLPMEVLSPGERGEGAFGVTPVPSPDGKIMTYPPPDWTGNMVNGGIVFLDELSTAPPALQPPILGLALSRRIGGSYLGKRVRILAAANPTEEAAGGWDLAPPLANRFGHLPWIMPDPEEWANWLLGSVDAEVVETINALDEEKRVIASWDEPWAETRGLVAAFIRSRGELLHKQPGIGHPDSSRAWPSHRTWEMAARAYTAASVHGMTAAERDEFTGAFVGMGAVSELVSFAKKNDLPKPLDVLEGRVKFEHSSKRLDRTFAVMSSCSALVCSESMKADPKRQKELVNSFFEIIAEVADEAIDLVYPATKQIADLDGDLYKGSKTAKAVMRKILPVAQKISKRR